MSTRRTKRRYAHELYPHAPEGLTRPLSEDVPYLYARAIGMEVQGTGWFDAEPGGIAAHRINELIYCRHLALIADALLQGMTGEEAWEWADQRAQEESGEWIGERSEIYGVPFYDIKPYPCGDEPDHHDHLDQPDARGWRTVHRIQGKESECEECTEEVQEAGQ